MEEEEKAGGGLEFGDDGGGEAHAVEAVGAGVAVEALGELPKRKAFGSEGAQAGLERGHEQRGGNALARDVGHGEHKLAARRGVGDRVEGVVVVAGDGILRAGGEGDFGVGDKGWNGRNEPGLNFAGDFEVALHGDFVGELERKEQKEKKSGEEFRFDFDGVVAELKSDTGEKKQKQRDEKKNAAGGSELVHQGPEKLVEDVERPAPTGELLNLFPVDVLAVETEAGAGVGCELGPQVVDGAAF